MNPEQLTREEQQSVRYWLTPEGYAALAAAEQQDQQ